MREGLKQIPRRVAKIALFAVVIGFAGFTACMPAHRYTPARDLERTCPAGTKLENGRCDCPGGMHQDGNRCVAAPLPPQNPPQP